MRTIAGHVTSLRWPPIVLATYKHYPVMSRFQEMQAFAIPATRQVRLHTPGSSRGVYGAFAGI